MKKYRVHIPKLGYGWQSEAAKYPDIYHFTLPPGKVLIHTPKINLVDSVFWNLGFTHRNYNDGVITDAIPTHRRAVCAGKTYVGAGILPADASDAEKRARTIDTFSDEECENVGVQLAAYNIFVEQAGEYVPGGHDTNWGLSDQFPQYIKIRKACAKWVRLRGKARAAAIRAAGGSERIAVLEEQSDDFGGYDGHNYFDSTVASAGVAWLRTHLQSDAAVVALVKDNSQNFRSGPNGYYYQQEQYLWRSGVIQLYYTTELTNVKKWVFCKVLAFQIDIMAKRALGVTNTSHTIGFSFVSGSDFMGYDSNYERPVTGGVYKTKAQAKPPVGAMLWVSIVAMLQSKGLMGWETTPVFGTNPNVIEPDEPGFREYVGTGGVTRLTANSNGGEPQDAPAPYPSQPKGLNDITFAAGWLYGKAWEYTQNEATEYAAVKMGSSFPTLNQGTYLVDQFENNLGTAIVLGQGNKRAVFYYGPGGTQTVLVSGQELAFDAPNNFPVCYHIEL